MKLSQGLHVVPNQACLHPSLVQERVFPSCFSFLTKPRIQKNKYRDVQNTVRWINTEMYTNQSAVEEGMFYGIFMGSTWKNSRSVSNWGTANALASDAVQGWVQQLLTQRLNFFLFFSFLYICLVSMVWAWMNIKVFWAWMDIIVGRSLDEHIYIFQQKKYHDPPEKPTKKA